jgi:7-carboxy-7-deazaguanine synthase
MSIREIVREVGKYPCRSVSITGGEPLVQKKELLELVNQLKALDYRIQMNTNGTIFDKEIFKLADLISMDCKCPSSGMKSDLDVLEKTIKLFEPKSQFKFIISNKKDYEYAKKIVSSSLQKASRVIFQPEWNSRKFAQKLVESVTRDSLSARVILQQQKMIWGPGEGYDASFL